MKLIRVIFEPSARLRVKNIDHDQDQDPDQGLLVKLTKINKKSRSFLLSTPKSIEETYSKKLRNAFNGLCKKVSNIPSTLSVKTKST